MKKNIFKAIMSLWIVIFFVFLCSFSGYASWIDKWFDQYIGSGPDYYQTQRRGYVTFGSFSTRTAVTPPERIFTFEPPRIWGGCGGIDIFLGSFSFVNPEYLVQKLQNLIQAAPAVAFHLALKILSSQLGDSVSWVENVLNVLNQLQFDECKIFEPVLSIDPRDYRNMDFQMRISSMARDIKEGYVNLWKKVREEYSGKSVSSEEKQKALEMCPVLIKNIASSGSVLEYVGRDLGIPVDFRQAIRGISGDVKIASNETSSFIEPNVTPEDLRKPQLVVKGKTVSGAEVETPLNFVGYVRNALLQGYQAKLSKSSPPESYVNVVKMSPIAIEFFIHAAAKAKDPTIVDTLSPVIAQALYYNLLLNVASKGKEIISKLEEPSGDIHLCPVAGTVSSNIRQMVENIDKAVEIISSVYKDTLKETSISLDFALKLLTYNSLVDERLSRAFGSNVSARILGM